MQSAAEHLEADEPDYLHAARDYAGAYVAMPRDVQVTEIGQYSVAEAVRIRHEVLWPATEDLDHLRTCEALARRHLDDLDEARAAGRLPPEPSSQETYIREALVSVRATLEAAQDEPAPVTPAPTPAPTPRQPPPEPPPRDMLALTLVSVGTVLAGGGTVLMVDGLLFPSMIAKAKARQRAIDEAQGDLLPSDPDPPAYVDHERAMRGRGHALLISGASSLVVGAVLLTWGNLRVARKRRAPMNAELRVAPRFGREGAGVSAVLRF